MAAGRGKTASPAGRGAEAGVAQSRIDPKRAAQARRLYEGSRQSTEAIAKQVGIARSTVQRLASRGGWKRPDAAEARRRLVGSIRQKAEREIVAAGRALKGGGDPGPAARTLASLVRTLRELAKYDEEQARACGRADPVDDEDFDDFLADPDAFRDALADRLEKLRDERET